MDKTGFSCISWIMATDGISLNVRPFLHSLLDFPLTHTREEERPLAPRHKVGPHRIIWKLGPRMLDWTKSLNTINLPQKDIDLSCKKGREGSTTQLCRRLGEWLEVRRSGDRARLPASTHFAPCFSQRFDIMSPNLAPFLSFNPAIRERIEREREREKERKRSTFVTSQLQLQPCMGKKGIKKVAILNPLTEIG